MAKKESYRIDIPISVVAENLEEVKRIEKLLKNLDKKKAKPQVDVDAKDAKKKAKEVEKELDKVDRKKAKPRVIVDVDDRQAKRKLSAFERVKRRKQEITIGAKDQASAVINRVKSRMAQLKSSNAARITITAVDRTRGVVNSIRKAITSAPAMITVGASAVGGAMGGAAAMSYITGGMEQARTQEHDMVRMTHWLKKDQENMKDMTGALNDSVRFTKQYASSTAFDMAPVNAAYATALQIAGGERGEAEKLLKIAGDMAILDDGDITRSMQAIFNAQNGLYEMMDAYSPKKINKEFVDSQGGMDGLLKFMEGETGGAAIAYGDTGVGAYNTMLGKMSLLKTEIGEAFHKGSIPFYKQLSDLFTKASDSAGPLLSIIEKIGVEIGNWSFDKMESAINTMKKAVGFDKVEDIFGGGYSTQVATTIDMKPKATDLFGPIENKAITVGKLGKRGGLIEDSQWSELQERFQSSAEKGLHLVQLGDSGYAFDLRKSVEENMADGPIPVSFEAKTETAIDSVKDSLSDWWQGEGKTAMLEVGEELGGKVVDAIVEGVPAIAEALASVIGGVVSDKVGEAIKNPSVGTIAGAGVALGGAGLLGSKLLSPVGGYRGAAKGIGTAGKGVGKAVGGIGRGIGSLIGGIGNVLTFGGRKRAKVLPRPSFAEQDRRAREYSTRPENYRPPQQTQRRAGGSGSGSPQNLGFASSGGPMSFMPKWLQGGGSGKLLKGVGGKIPGLNMVLGGVDAYSGFKDADRRAGGEAGGLDKAASSFATVLEGFTFGLLDGDKTYEKIRGKKVPGEEVTPEVKGAKSDEGLKGALPEDDAFEAFKEMGDAGGMSEIVQQFQARLEAITEGLEGVDEFAESFDAVSEIFEQLEESLTSMTENLEEPAEQFAESFTEVAELTEGMQESIEELTESLEEPTEQFVESFTEVAEMMEEMQESLEELSEVLEEPTEQFVESFTEVAEMMEEMKESLEELSEVLEEPTEQFVESFTEVAEMMEEMKESLEELSESLEEPTEQFVESFTEVAELMAQLQETIEGFNESMQEPVEQFVESFAQVSENTEQINEMLQGFAEGVAEPSQQFIESLTEVSAMLEQSAETLEEFNSSITEGAAELMANMTTLGQTLIQSGEVVQTGMNAIGSKTSEVVGALGTLVGHINTGASAMSGMSQVQAHVTALNSALQGLATKVRNVQVPSSIGGGGGGPTKAYAKGGIATSPHIGLVAEAGVPEAMIPFDGSSRSKDLWMTTGHALGMFDTTTSSIDPIDTTPKPTPQESGGSNTFNIPININGSGNTEEIIEQAKQEVANALRLVLSTT